MLSMLEQAPVEQGLLPSLAMHGGPKVRRAAFPPDRTRPEAAANTVTHAALSTADRLVHDDAPAALERAFRAWLGGGSVVASASGAAAWRLALAALDLESGDEVIVSPVIDGDSVRALLDQGVTPVFADLDPVTYGPAPREVARQITSRTRAIAVQHLWGRPVDLDPLLAVAQRHQLSLIEDCRQACGATYRGRKIGLHGDLACFSLRLPGSGGAGDCGLTVAAESDWAARLRRARASGTSILQAPETGDVLARLDEQVTLRQWLGDLLAGLIGELTGLSTPPLPAASRAAPAGFPIVVDTQRIGVPVLELVAAITAEGIPATAGYSTPVYLTPVLSQVCRPGVAGQALAYRPGLCRVAEHLPGRLFTVPLDERFSEADVRDIAAGIRKVVSARWLPLLLRLSPAGRHVV